MAPLANDAFTLGTQETTVRMQVGRCTSQCGVNGPAGGSERMREVAHRCEEELGLLDQTRVDSSATTSVIQTALRAESKPLNALMSRAS